MDAKQLFETVTGYWMYKKKHLPLGTSLKIDIESRFNYANMKVIFDVGANVGQTHKAFSKDFPEATIYCFEPIKATFETLKKNVSKRDRSAILENVALGDMLGEKEVSLYEDWNVLNSLNDALMNPSDNAKKQVVTIDTINNYCKRNAITHIDLLKIDTEGYEMQVLNGATELLQFKGISFILCEVGFLKKNTRNTNFSVLSEHLERYGYYYVSMFNGGNESWNKGLYYGNALFANSELKFH